MHYRVNMAQYLLNIDGLVEGSYSTVWQCCNKSNSGKMLGMGTVEGGGKREKGMTSKVRPEGLVEGGRLEGGE